MIELTKEQLQQKYVTRSNDNLCKELGISEVTLVKILKENGIQMKGKGGRYQGGHNRKIKIISGDQAL